MIFTKFPFFVLQTKRITSSKCFFFFFPLFIKVLLLKLYENNSRNRCISAISSSNTFLFCQQFTYEPTFQFFILVQSKFSSTWKTNMGNNSCNWRIFEFWWSPNVLLFPNIFCGWENFDCTQILKCQNN